MAERKSERNINIRLNTSPSEQMIVDKQNNLIEQTTNCINEESDSEYDQQISCSHYSSDEFIKASFQSNKIISIMHKHSLDSVAYCIEELRILLGALDYMFDFIAISESKSH